MKKNSLIYIAGGTGLVGSAVVRFLKDQGYINLCYSNPWVSNPLYERINLADESKVLSYMTSYEPEYVIMAAAKVGGINANNTQGADFITENLQIQTNLIKWSHAIGVKKLLFLGSSCIYPKFTIQPIQEESLLTGPLEETNKSYAIAKIAGIEMVNAYRKQYNCDFISAMPTNLYGPGDNYDLQNSHVLPALIRKFHDAKINNLPYVEVWGTGSPTREFLYVDDLAEALVFLMNEYSKDSHINVGTGKDISIKDLALLIKNIIEFDGEIHWNDKFPDGTPQKLLDVSKINKLGWKAKTSLYSGIKKTYESYLKNTEWL